MRQFFLNVASFLSIALVFLLYKINLNFAAPFLNTNKLIFQEIKERFSA